MLDQSYMRHWVANHDQISRDLHKALQSFARFVGRALGASPRIGSVYAETAGRAMIVGLAASATTTLLFLGVGALSLHPGARA